MCIFNNHNDNWKHGAEIPPECVYIKAQPTTSSNKFLSKVCLYSHLGFFFLLGFFMLRICKLWSFVATWVNAHACSCVRHALAEYVCTSPSPCLSKNGCQPTATAWRHTETSPVFWSAGRLSAEQICTV